MTADREPSLADLLDLVPRDELMRMIARRGRVARDVFLEALHLDLDSAIERLETEARHYATDDDEKLTRFLATQLACAGYTATCETEAPEHTGFKVVNRAARIAWTAQARTYRDHENSIDGILYLLHSGMSGRHPHGGFLLYVRDAGSAQRIEGWRAALPQDERVNCHEVSSGDGSWAFLSKHVHPSGSLITIRHHAVLLACGAHPSNTLQSSSPRKHTILFLAANPSRTDPLALDQEARAIAAELERGGCRDRFEFVTRWAVEPLDLLHELRKLRPTVVHFAGPGPNNVGSNGHARSVSAKALKQTFGAAGTSVRLVVLNGCYSKGRAKALLAHVDCVVGLGGSLHRDATKSFAIGFYGGLGEREPVAAAYKQGQAAISLLRPNDGHLPQLRVRSGVDADHLVLT